jgi:flavin-dependent dehydrogenase
MIAPRMRYDVVILGGALAGASTALLLRRRSPHLKVLIVEKNPRFDFKVGESTVETSAYFLSRVLRLYDYLSREQLPKHGLRYFFHNGKARTLAEGSEVGPNQLPRVGTFQLDRAKLDEHVLAEAVAAGAELWRPAKVVDVLLPEELGEAEGKVVVEREGTSTELRAGWIIDASGRTGVIARKRGWIKPLEEHPISAVWARYTGVKDLDGFDVHGNDLESPFARYSVASRRLGTCHFNGYGYWIWFIPLSGGETSVGAVYDRRMVRPSGATAEERLNWFLDGNPQAKVLMEGSRRIADDLYTYAHLPYLVDKVAGVGWSLVGDAAGFLDPFYSPGIDQIAFSVSWALELIRRQPEKDFGTFVGEHDVLYRQYLRGLFETIYKDKYALMGDYDLMTAAFMIDTALYYRFVCGPIYKKGPRNLLNPPFYKKYSNYAWTVIAFYQRRLVSIARRKWKLGIYGNHNAGRRPKFMGFSLALGMWVMLLNGLRRWIGAEISNAWSYIARPRPLKDGMPGPVTATEEAPAPAALPEEPAPVGKDVLTK